MNLFTSDELYVLASLLGKEFIIGIEGRTLEENRARLPEMFEENFKSLESKGVFEYKIDGTLLIDREVRDSVARLNDADTVYLIATDRNGKKENVIYLGNKGSFCKLISEASRYALEMVDTVSYERILSDYGVVIPDSPSKCAEILLEDFKRLDRLYDSFNSKEADEFLMSVIDDADTAGLLRECLTKRNGFLVLKRFDRVDSHLVNNRDTLLMLRYINGRMIAFSVEGINTVKINIFEENN